MQIENTASGHVIAVAPVQVFKKEKLSLGLADGLMAPEVRAQTIKDVLALQRKDGGWDEALSTGTGFPRVFYLKYHLYRQSFPVLALASYLKTRSNGADHS